MPHGGFERRKPFQGSNIVKHFETRVAVISYVRRWLPWRAFCLWPYAGYEFPLATMELCSHRFALYGTRCLNKKGVEITMAPEKYRSTAAR